MNKQTSLFFGALLGGLGIALGAFGAHALKEILLANNKLDVYETAVRYQVYHALALLLGSILMKDVQNRFLRLATICWTIGIVLFSGSLYVISFASPGPFVFLTPAGGLFLLSGWGFLLWSIVSNKE